MNHEYSAHCSLKGEEQPYIDTEGFDSLREAKLECLSMFDLYHEVHRVWIEDENCSVVWEKLRG